MGDVYALLVEYYHSQQNMQQAYMLIEKMRGRNIILSPYLVSARLFRTTVIPVLVACIVLSLGLLRLKV
eukprot:SAG11_NODE_3158_length_2643_cov_2.460299_4_plen_69_part_00